MLENTGCAVNTANVTHCVALGGAGILAGTPAERSGMSQSLSFRAEREIRFFLFSPNTGH